MSEREIVICNPVRTAIGTYGGSLKDTPAPDLGATVIRETLNRSGLSVENVDTVVMGNVIQAGAKMNPARQAAVGCRSAGARSCDDGEPGVRLGRTGDRERGARDPRRLRIVRHRRRHGEHGPGAVSDGGRAVGLSDGRCARSTTACCAMA